MSEEKPGTSERVPFADSTFVPGERLTISEVLQHTEIALNRDSPVRLEAIKDEHRHAIQRHGRMLQGVTGIPISPGDDRTDDFLHGSLWHTYRPRRSAYHHVRPGLVWALKGNGERGWRVRSVLLVDPEGGPERRAPITFNETPLLPSLAYYGGLPLQIGTRELIVGLLLRGLCRKEGVTPSLIEPLIVSRPAALPWEEGGSIAVHPAREHLGKLRYEGALPLAMKAVRELNADDFGSLCVVHSVGNSIHARVPEYQLVDGPPLADEAKADDHDTNDEAPLPPQGRDLGLGSRTQVRSSEPRQRSTRSMYRDLPLDEATRRSMVLVLAQRVGAMLKVARAYGIAFSLDPHDVRKRTGHPLLSTQFSSMHPSNISMEGEVCDLETVRGEPFGDAVTEQMLQQDVDNAYDTIRLWGAALDLEPRFGLAKLGVATLEKVCGVPPPWG